MDKYIYAIREVRTGRLAYNLTNPQRKYWDTEEGCQRAIDRYCSKWGYDTNDYKLVKYRLEEVAE